MHETPQRPEDDNLSPLGRKPRPFSDLRDVTQFAREQGAESVLALKSSDELTHEIERTAKLADDHTIVAAMALRELRARVEGGSVGPNIKWFAWARKNIKVTEARLYRLQAIAEADDPNAELERMRKQDRERAKRYREKQKIERIAPDPDRTALIRWARKAPIGAVIRILNVIGERDFEIALGKARSVPVPHH